MAPLRYIPCSFDRSNADTSVLELVFKIHPDWKIDSGLVNVVRLKGGITNAVSFPLSHFLNARLTY